MGKQIDDNRDEAELARLLRAAGRGPTASADARSRIYAAVQSEWRRNTVVTTARARRPAISTGRWTFWLPRALPVAAAVAAVVIGLRLLDTPSPISGIQVAALTKTAGSVIVLADDRPVPATPSQPATVVRAGNVIRTTGDSSASLTLTNGAVVRVSADTELLLAAENRIELRRGMVYVDAGADPDTARSLELETPFGSVSHIGTQYETRVGSNNLRIRVREGVVRYATVTPSGETVETRGTAGEQLLAIVGDGEIQRSSIALTGPEWAWVESLATVPAGDSHALDALLEWVARETGRELRFADDSVAVRAQRETVVGVAGLTPAETLAVIARSTGLDVAETDVVLLVR